MTDAADVIAKAYLTMLRIPHNSLLRHQPETQNALCECRDWLAEHMGEDAEIVQVAAEQFVARDVAA